MKKADIIGGIIGIILSIYVFYQSGKFPKDVVMNIGPSYFPRILAVALLVISVMLIINATIGKSKKTYEKFDIRDKGIQRAGVAILGTIIYCIVLNYIGFEISSIIYLFFLMFLLKKRNYLKMILISICVTFIILIVFKILLNITFPSILF